MHAQQRGMTLLTMINIMLFVSVALLAIKIVPEYVENRSVNAILQDVATDADISSLGRAGIQQAIYKRFEINDISLPPNAITINRSGSGSGWAIDLAYDRSLPIVYNMSVVISFSHHYEAVKP